MQRLLSFLGGKLQQILVRNQPAAGRLFDTVSGLSDAVGIAHDFMTDGFSLGNVGQSFMSGVSAIASAIGSLFGG